MQMIAFFRKVNVSKKKKSKSLDLPVIFEEGSDSSQ